MSRGISTVQTDRTTVSVKSRNRALSRAAEGRMVRLSGPTIRCKTWGITSPTYWMTPARITDREQTRVATPINMSLTRRLSMPSSDWASSSPWLMA